jgi:tRNA threonylcarbamoyladenosine biosynthesis protein TsaE
MKPAMNEIICPTPDDTRAFASKVAALVHPGDIVVLAGPLGAGKTLFTGGLAAGLGVDEAVVSPSFVLVREYRSGFLPLIHADVYRLSTFNEFADLDVFEQAADGVLVIEWGDAIEAALPLDHLRVEFAADEQGQRTLTLVPNGSWAERDWESIL